MRPPAYQLVAGINVRSLPLEPEVAFVLSRVDGHTDAAAIAMATGISAERVATHLQRLEELGAVRLPGAPARKNKPSQPPRAPAPDHAAALASAAAAAPTPVVPAGPRHPDIDDSLSISVELQARILDLSSRLADLDHFALLGVERRADRVAIKQAYFAMIGTFHPDRYFGKQLGSFTKRMEKIFQRLTEAHDVLANRQAREEYEAYLGALGRTRGLDAPPEEGPSVEDLERLLLQAEQEARNSPPPAPDPVAVRAAPQPPPLPLPPPLPRPSIAPSIRPPVQLVDDPAARRQALARKFGLTGSASMPPEPPNDDQIRAEAARHSAAAKELHDRYQHRKVAIRDRRIERFARAAEEAIAAGNNVAALNTLKIARTLSDGQVGAGACLDELEKKVGSTVVESYVQRARYEETNGQYEEAARSYTRAARGSPSAEMLRSAAECYLKAGVELRLAGELAREATQLEPDRSDLRLTLAKIYETAGMPQNAVRELERALTLTPNSDRIKQWLKRLQRGGV